MVTTTDRTAIETTCRDKLGLNEEQTIAAIRNASGRIAAAAITNRGIEAGKALIRLEDIYERSLRVQDMKNALATQKEINKLIGLYPQNKDGNENQEGQSQVIEAIRGHLEPLGIAPDGASIVELVRLSVSKFIESDIIDVEFEKMT